MRNLVFPLWIAVHLVLPSLSAQSGFGLRVTGGSVPGQIDMRAGPGIPSGSFGVVLISLRLQNIPLSLLDPPDPRSLAVGLELGAISPFGPITSGSLYAAPPLVIPNQPSFIDGALFFQSTFIPGLQFFIGDLSLPQAVRFGPTGQFRDRSVFMFSSRAFFPVVRVPDGRWMVAGGGSGGLLAQVPLGQVEFYNELSDQFESGTSMNAARAIHTATPLLDGRILLAAGVDLRNDPIKTTEFWDSNVGFVAGPQMNVERMGHTATELLDGRILITGGLQNLNIGTGPLGQLDPIFSAQRSTEIFDPFTNTFTPGPNMSEERAAHTATLLPDGRVLIAGGIGFFRFITNLPTVERTTDIFDPLTNTITPGPTMISRRAAQSVTDLGGGRFMFAGGVDDLDFVNQGTPTSSCEIYDSTAGSFSPAASMAAARGLHQTFDVGNGRLLAIGGADGSILTPNPLASTEFYDVASNVWTAGPPLPNPAAAYGAYVNDHGQVHVLGGSDGGIPGVVNSSAWFYR